MTVGMDPVTLGLTRATFTALYKARAAIRLYPLGHRLREDSREEFRLSTMGAVRERSLEAVLGPKTLLVDGITVFEEALADDLLRRLAAIGVCSIHIRMGVRVQELDALIDLCADSATYGDETSPDWAARVWQTDCPHIKLSADSTGLDHSSRILERSAHALSSLPVGPSAQVFASAVAREATLNLPIQVASSVLEMAGSAEAAQRSAILTFLDALLRDLLHDFDLQGAAWILDEAERQGSLTASERKQLIEDRQELGDSQWWLQCIASTRVRDSSALGAFVLHYGPGALAAILQAPELLAHAGLELAVLTLVQMDATPFFDFLRNGNPTQREAALDLILAAGLSIPETLATGLICGSEHGLAKKLLRARQECLPSPDLLTCLRQISDGELRSLLFQTLIDSGNPEVFECLGGALVGPQLKPPVQDDRDAERIIACLAKSLQDGARELLERLASHASRPQSDRAAHYLR